jgi:4-azaleucine resistance transporter AzlC
MKMKALKAAFPYTVPILLGFLFLGIAYGIYMDSKGFSFLYPMLMSLTIFAGSMQFVAANLLLGPFSPLTVFLMTLMVNARHLFYGISMLEKYKGTGLKKWYLIFGMCDESFSINVSIEPPEGVDRGWFIFFVNLLNHGYWVLGSTLGGLLGNLVRFNTEGLDFVMTALFVVIFTDQWLKTKNHIPALVGIGASVVSLVLFRASGFILPAMALIVLSLTVLKKRIEQKEAAVK